MSLLNKIDWENAEYGDVFERFTKEALRKKADMRTHIGAGLIGAGAGGLLGLIRSARRQKPRYLYDALIGAGLGGTAGGLGSGMAEYIKDLVDKNKSQGGGTIVKQPGPNNNSPLTQDVRFFPDKGPTKDNRAAEWFKKLKNENVNPDTLTRAGDTLNAKRVNDDQIRQVKEMIAKASDQKELVALRKTQNALETRRDEIQKEIAANAEAINKDLTKARQDKRNEDRTKSPFRHKLEDFANDAYENLPDNIYNSGLVGTAAGLGHALLRIPVSAHNIARAIEAEHLAKQSPGSKTYAQISVSRDFPASTQTPRQGWARLLPDRLLTRYFNDYVRRPLGFSPYTLTTQQAGTQSVPQPNPAWQPYQEVVNDYNLAKVQHENNSKAYNAEQKQYREQLREYDKAQKAYDKLTPSQKAATPPPIKPATPTLTKPGSPPDPTTFTRSYTAPRGGATGAVHAGMAGATIPEHIHTNEPYPVETHVVGRNAREAGRSTAVVQNRKPALYGWKGSIGAALLAGLATPGFNNAIESLGFNLGDWLTPQQKRRAINAANASTTSK